MPESSEKATQMRVEIGILFALGAMLNWGIADFLAKLAIDRVGYETALLVNALTSVIPLSICGVLFFEMPFMTYELLLVTMATGVLGTFGYLSFYKGLSKGNVSVVSPISSSWAIITAILATVLFKERLNALSIVGIATSFVGIFLASTDLEDFRNDISQGFPDGSLEAMIAMVTWGITFTMMKLLVDMTGAVVALLFMRGMSLLLLLSRSCIIRRTLVVPTQRMSVLLIVAGLLDTLGFLAYCVGITTEFVSIVSPISAMFPAITVLLAYLFLKERIANSQKVGIGAILVGLFLVSSM